MRVDAPLKVLQQCGIYSMINTNTAGLQTVSCIKFYAGVWRPLLSQQGIYMGRLAMLGLPV